MSNSNTYNSANSSPATGSSSTGSNGGGSGGGSSSGGSNSGGITIIPPSPNNGGGSTGNSGGSSSGGSNSGSGGGSSSSATQALIEQIQNPINQLKAVDTSLVALFLGAVAILMLLVAWKKLKRGANEASPPRYIKHKGHYYYRSLSTKHRKH